jgi:hypothetical protein
MDPFLSYGTVAVDRKEGEFLIVIEHLREDMSECSNDYGVILNLTNPFLHLEPRS